MRHEQDLFNYPNGPWIPDCINTHFKYVIEIDGSIHDQKYKKSLDEKKTNYYRNRGFKVFRIKAFDESALNLIQKEVLKLRTNAHPGCSIPGLSGIQPASP